MENIHSGSFLEVWHHVMLIGALILFAAGIGVYIFHHLKVAAIQSPKGKYDYISRREIKNLEIVFILFAIACTMLINRYGMEVDIMIEAKAKEQAILRIMRHL